jgi:hypothetical protein
VAHGPVNRARPDELLVGGAEVVAEMGALIILDGRCLLDPMAASRSRRCATASGNGSSWSSIPAAAAPARFGMGWPLRVDRPPLT